MQLSGCVGWEVQEEGGANDEVGWRRIDERQKKSKEERRLEKEVGFLE